MSPTGYSIISVFEILNWKSSSHKVVLSSDYLQQRMSEEEQITEGLEVLDEREQLYKVGGRKMFQAEVKKM